MTRNPIQAVAQAAPVVDDALASPSMLDSLGGLAQAITATQPRRSRRPRTRRAKLAVVAVALAAVPIATAGTYFVSAHTGWFGVPGMTENDTSEWLRTDAADFAPAIAGVIPGVGLPPGASWTVEIARQVREGRTAPGLVQTTGVVRTFEAYARCAWLRSWLIAQEAGDRAAAQRAEKAIDQSVRWPATIATDGGGVVEHIGAVGAAARAGDAVGVRQELAVGCDRFDLRGVR